MKKHLTNRIISVFLIAIMTTSLIPGIFSLASSEPYEFSAKYRWDDFEDGDFASEPGSAWKYKVSESGGIIDEADGRTNLKRNGESGTLELAIPANGSYPYTGTALVKFTLHKSPDAEGIVYFRPNYLNLKWSGDKISLAYRDTPEEPGDSVTYRELEGVYSDDVEVVFFANVPKSRFTLWLNGEAVAENKYSSSNSFSGVIGAPSKLEDIRLISTGGNDGDIFSLDNFESGIPEYKELKVDLDHDWLTYGIINGGETSVLSDINLPVIGKNGSQITWTSSDSSLISSTGEVTRPSSDEEDKHVTLYAVLEAEGVTSKKSFDFLVLKEAGSDEEAVQYDADYLTVERITWQDKVLSDLKLPIVGVYGSTITWTSGNEEIISHDGIVNRAGCNGTDTTVTMTATINKGEYYQTKDMDFVVMAEDTMLDAVDTYIDEDFSTSLSDKWTLNGIGGKIETTDGVLKMSRFEDNGDTSATLQFDSKYKGMVGFSTLVSRPKGDDVSVKFEMHNGSKEYFWLSVYSDGRVEFLACLEFGQRPNFVSAKKNMTGDSARFSVWMDAEASTYIVYMDGEAISDTLYSYASLDSVDVLNIKVNGKGPSEVLIDDLKVFKALPLKKDRLNYDYDHLTIDQLSPEAVYGFVSKDLTLPTTGYCGSTITWTSSKPDIVSNDGKVTLPVGLSEDPKVSLTAFIVYDGARLRKSFSFYVIRSFDTAEEKVNADFEHIMNNLGSVTSEDLGSITRSLNFNLRTRYGSNISFKSSDTSVVTNSGRVIRPRDDEADKTCVITLVVSAEGVEKTHSFNVTVKADEPFVDPQFMPDEEFFGRYENGEWTVESKFDYENTPELSGVESAVKSGDYTLAKEKLLEYARCKDHNFSISLSNRDTLRAETIIDRIDGAPDHGFREGVLYVDDVLGSYSAPINRTHLKNGRITLKLISWYNEASELEIYSREGDIFKSAYIEMNINGVPAKYYVTEDTTIRAGSYKNANYDGEDKLYSKTYGNFLGDETKHILLKFDLSDIPGDAVISDAKLVINGRSAPAGSGTKKILIAYEIDSSWKEAEVCWNDFLGMFFNFNQVGFDWNEIENTDIEFKWQLPRFYGMYSVVSEYLYTGDEKYAYGIIKLFEEYLTEKAGATNLYNDDSSGIDDGRDLYMRGQYPRSLDAAERMENWVSVMYFIAQSEYMTPDAITAIYKHIWDLFEATTKNYANDGANWEQNELIRVMRYGDDFPEFRSSEEWLDIAVDRLSYFIFHHNLSDGAYMEATGGYPGNALKQFIEFRKLAYDRGIEVSKEYDEMLLKVAYYNQLMRLPDGRDPGWGDASLGRGPSVRTSAYTEINDFMDDEEYEYISTVGKSGKEPTWTSKVFDVGRIAFLRSSWSKDAMYMMTNVRGGGGHSDADDNHIFLMAYSQPLLVDSGIASYTSGTVEGDYCGATIGHNTVEVNGITQPNPVPRDQWRSGEMTGFVSNQTFDFLKSTSVAYYTHDHERNILFIKPYYVIVSDYLAPDAAGSINSYKQLWHMLPEGKLSVDENKGIIKSNFDTGANVILASVDNDAITQTGDGYFDYSYNDIYEIKHGYFYKEHEGDTTFDTVIVPNRNDKNATLETERIELGVDTTTATSFKFVSDADGATNTGYYYLSYEDTYPVREFDKFETDGEMAFANENTDGIMNIIALKNASYLKMDGEYVVLLDEKVNDIAIAIQGTELVIDSSEENLENLKISGDFKFKTLIVNGDSTAHEKKNGFFVINPNGNVEKPSDNPVGGNLTGGSGGGGGGGASSGDEKPSVPDDNKENEDTEVVTPSAVESKFKDVADSHWAKEAVESLYSKGIVNGKSDGIYAPDDNVTRAEFVTLIVRSLDSETTKYNSSFDDISSTDWYADSVETALSLGLISKDTKFRPNDSITREEMAKIIVGAAELDGKVDLPAEFALSFADTDAISDWASDFVSKAVHLNLLKGDDLGNFNPQNNLTRAESAMVIYRFLQ